MLAVLSLPPLVFACIYTSVRNVQIFQREQYSSMIFLLLLLLFTVLYLKSELKYKTSKKPTDTHKKIGANNITGILRIVFSKAALQSRPWTL